MLSPGEHEKDYFAASYALPTHVADEQLLLALDGELSSSEKATVESHLVACWSCRVRSSQLAEAIGLLVEYRSSLVGSVRSISPGSRSMFAAQLDELAKSLDRPSWVVRLKAAWRDMSVRHLSPRYVWLGSLAICILLLAWFINLRKAPGVPATSGLSAGELLQYAEAAEVRALSQVAQPVVFRRLRIRAGGHSVTRTVYRDVKRSHRSEHLSFENGDVASASAANISKKNSNHSSLRDEEQSLQQIFREAGLDWEEPLSPTSYRVWREKVSRRHEEMSDGGDGFTTLKTLVVEGPIEAASITIRRADFHLVAADFGLRDSGHVKVDELDWQVLPLEVVNPAIFSDGPPEPPAPIDISDQVSAPVLEEPNSNLEETELRARVALHATKADLGEEIDFDGGLRSGSDAHNSLVLRGIVVGPRRKAELAAALRGIPNLDLQLRSVDEIVSPEKRDKLHEVQGAFGSELPSISNDGLDDHREVVKSADEHIALVNRLISVTQNASAQVWALLRLKERYTPEKVRRLNLGQRGTLELLIRDDLSGLAASLDEIEEISARLDGDEQPLSLSHGLAYEAELPVHQIGDWRQAVAGAFGDVEKLHINVAVLFGQPDQILPDQQDRVQELRSILRTLRGRLPLLRNLVSGSFLSDIN